MTGVEDLFDEDYEARLSEHLSEYQREIMARIKAICATEGKKFFFYLNGDVLAGEVEELAYDGALEALRQFMYKKNGYIHLEILKA